MSSLTKNIVIKGKAGYMLDYSWCPSLQTIYHLVIKITLSTKKERNQRLRSAITIVLSVNVCSDARCLQHSMLLPPTFSTHSITIID